MSAKQSKRLSKEEVKEICKDLEEFNGSVSDIAKKHNVHHTTVRKIANGMMHEDISKDFDFTKYNERETKPKKSYETLPNNIIIAICEDLQNTDMSLIEIGKKYDVSHSNVSKIYHRKVHADISKPYKFKERPSFNSGVRLNTDEVNDICKDLQDTNMSLRGISRKHNVSPRTVRDIYYHRSHKYISAKYKFKPETFYKHSANTGDYNTSIDTIYNLWNSIVLGNSNREYIQMMKRMMVYGYRLGKSKIDIDFPDDFYEL
jgi:predicted DNA-binding ArsR family transcriptional regulator